MGMAMSERREGYQPWTVLGAARESPDVVVFVVGHAGSELAPSAAFDITVLLRAFATGSAVTCCSASHITRLGETNSLPSSDRSSVGG